MQPRAQNLMLPVQPACELGQSESDPPSKCTARRQYTDEFKREAVGLLVSSGRPLSRIAQELGIAPSRLRARADISRGEHRIRLIDRNFDKGKKLASFDRMLKQRIDTLQSK